MTRRPRTYPKGPLHPKITVTTRWRAAVIRQLAANRRTGREPSTATALARMVGADKAGLLRMLGGAGMTYKYARQICDVLGIEEATVDNPALPEVSVHEVELETTLEWLRSLPADRRRRALAALRSLTASLDDA